MTDWFKSSYQFQKSNNLTLIQITDSHLFAQPSGCYFDVNTLDNLKRCLSHIAQYENFDGLVFSGDITQDHSQESYYQFTRAIIEADLNLPVFWLPGNHDEISLYLASFCEVPFQSAKRLLWNNWQISLFNSKSDTPAGWVSQAQMDEHKLLLDSNSEIEHLIAFSHHHPLPVAGYLDKHILQNGEDWLSQLCVDQKLRAVFHGHVHNEYTLDHDSIPVYGTPATSIQFKKHTADWQVEDTGPAYRKLCINSSGKLTTHLVWVHENQ